MDRGSAALSRSTAFLAAWPRVLYFLPVLFLVIFFFYPLAVILATSLASGRGLDIAVFGEIIASPVYLETVWFTFWQAALSTFLTLVLGLPLAHVFAKYDFPGKRLFQALSTIPFVLPTVVEAAAFTAFLGPKGRLNELLMAVFQLPTPPLSLDHSIWIILLAHIFYNYTLVLRMVGGFWSNLDPRMEEAARVLGASESSTFWRVTLPLLTPAIAAAALLTFIFTFTSFGAILILGGPKFATIEVEIYRQSLFYLNLPLAAAFVLLQLLFTTLATVAYTHLSSRLARPLKLRPKSFIQRRPDTWKKRTWVASNLAFATVFLLLPILALIDRSLATSQGFGLNYYQTLLFEPSRSVLFVSPWQAIRNSLIVATTTVILSLSLGLIAADFLTRRISWFARLSDAIFMLPLGTSAVTLGLGFLLALDEPPLNLRTSPLLLPLAHTLVAFPFVVRALLPVLRSIQPHLREAASSLGASPFRVWENIDLPIMWRALLVAAVFAFTISMGEFGATSLIARPEFPTMPIAIYRFLSQPGELIYGQALAMSTLLMVVVGGGILAIERFRFRGIGEF